MHQKTKNSSNENDFTIRKVEDFLNKYYPEIESFDVSKILESVNIKDNFLHAPIIFLLNFSNKGYDYVSPNVSELFDITAKELQTDGLSVGIKLFPPEYWKLFVNELLPEIITQFYNYANEGLNLIEMKAHYNIPMYNLSKEVGNTLHILKPIVLDSTGMPLLALKYILDISEYAKESNIRLKMEYTNENRSVQLKHSKVFTPDKLLVISKREEEIMKNIGSGMSSKEIAETLNISIHTVNTHRKNIMRKYNIQNFQQFFYSTK